MQVRIILGAVNVQQYDLGSADTLLLAIDSSTIFHGAPDILPSCNWVVLPPGQSPTGNIT